MADFSHLAKLKADDETLAEYTFTEVPGRPSIWLSPAVDDNPVYRNERARIALNRAKQTEAEARRSKRGAKIPEITPEMIVGQQDEELANDRILIARCCAKRWGVPPKDTHGDEPEFSEANCYDFLCALPDWMFRPFNNFSANVRNFVDMSWLDDDGEELGNS